MERYTLKVDNEYISNIIPNKYHNQVFPCIQKLGQLEDIEQELGIDLITLFKALNCGIYDKDENRNVAVYLTWHDYLKEFVLFYDDENPYYNGCYQFKDYGKTWALTKEELL